MLECMRACVCDVVFVYLGGTCLGMLMYVWHVWEFVSCVSGILCFCSAFMMYVNLCGIQSVCCNSVWCRLEGVTGLRMMI